MRAHQPGSSVPEKAPLVHFCAGMTEGPMGVQSLPANVRQSAWLDAISQKAATAGVPNWDTFLDEFKKIKPTNKQAWIEAGVKKYGLQTECEVLLIK